MRHRNRDSLASFKLKRVQRPAVFMWWKVNTDRWLPLVSSANLNMLNCQFLSASCKHEARLSDASVMAATSDQLNTDSCCMFSLCSAQPESCPMLQGLWNDQVGLQEESCTMTANRA